MNRVLATLISFTISYILSAQFVIGLHGEVTDYFTGNPIKNAHVSIHCDGFSDSLITRSDGIYAFELQRKKYYTLIARKEGMVDKRVCIQTDSVPDYPDVPFYDMDVQLVLFEWIPDFDFSLFDQPLGIAEYKHSVRNMSWENDYTERVDRLLLKPTMREYEKARAGYYERKSIRKGERVEPETPNINDVIVTSARDTDWTRSTSLIIRDSVTSIELDTIEYWEEPEEADLSTSVFTIEGLFFTVQVGVYTSGVSLSFEDQVPNIRPLNSEVLEDGNLTRYTTGRYSNLADAQARMEWCKKNGVPDAFVTAYLNGERISVNRAMDALSSYGPSILAR